MASLGLVGIVGHDDVRVAQPGYRLDFALESLHERRGLGDFAREDLDGHDTFHAAVASFEDRPHAAGPEFVEHLVVADYQVFKPPLAHGLVLKRREFSSGNQALSDRLSVGGLRRRQVFKAFFDLFL